MVATTTSSLTPYLKPDATVYWHEGIPCVPIQPLSEAIAANSYYFGHPDWASGYFEACHRDEAFLSRWRSAIGNWDGKIVVDVGCGPGNLYATVGGSPQLLIGIDVSFGGLQMARKIGYTPLLADAQNLPLLSEFADIVTINASLHHCDDMETTLLEAARLVKPGGMLITDHDPQYSAWHFRGIGRLLWDLRLPLYRFLQRGGHASNSEQNWALATEAHHRPGDGMSVDFYHHFLEPLGFAVNVYPHNHTVGEEVFQGNYGRSERKYRIGQRLSGIQPDSPEAALSLMCVATKTVNSNC